MNAETKPKGRRGRKEDPTLAPSRSRDIQRAFRARRAAHLANLEARVAFLGVENAELRRRLGLPEGGPPLTGPEPEPIVVPGLAPANAAASSSRATGSGKSKQTTKNQVTGLLSNEYDDSGDEDAQWQESGSWEGSPPAGMATGLGVFPLPGYERRSTSAGPRSSFHMSRSSTAYHDPPSSSTSFGSRARIADPTAQPGFSSRRQLASPPNVSRLHASTAAPGFATPAYTPSFPSHLPNLPIQSYPFSAAPPPPHPVFTHSSVHSSTTSASYGVYFVPHGQDYPTFAGYAQTAPQFGSTTTPQTPPGLPLPSLNPDASQPRSESQPQYHHHHYQQQHQSIVAFPSVSSPSSSSSSQPFTRPTTAGPSVSASFFQDEDFLLDAFYSVPLQQLDSSSEMTQEQAEAARERAEATRAMYRAFCKGMIKAFKTAGKGNGRKRKRDGEDEGDAEGGAGGSETGEGGYGPTAKNPTAGGRDGGGAGTSQRRGDPRTSAPAGIVAPNQDESDEEGECCGGLICCCAPPEIDPTSPGALPVAPPSPFAPVAFSPPCCPGTTTGRPSPTPVIHLPRPSTSSEAGATDVYIHAAQAYLLLSPFMAARPASSALSPISPSSDRDLTRNRTRNRDRTAAAPPRPTPREVGKMLHVDHPLPRPSGSTVDFAQPPHVVIVPPPRPRPLSSSSSAGQASAPKGELYVLKQAADRVKAELEARERRGRT
ncbi:hypothetical protein JCM1840_004059 [Sporobolomyces johnsonii]